jgi:ABC-type molybdenum transport system ATPase subunit/photorepair protein PhrA
MVTLPSVLILDEPTSGLGRYTISIRSAHLLISRRIHVISTAVNTVAARSTRPDCDSLHPCAPL